jgi:hypothetical protein
MNGNKEEHAFSVSNQNVPIVFEKYVDLPSLDVTEKDELKEGISHLLKESWGAFPADFINSHILNTDKIFIAKSNKQLVGFCALSIKNVLGLKIHYIEFLVIDKKFQNSRIGSNLFFSSIKDEIIGNILSLLLGASLEIMFITPNIRTLSHFARFASFIYPNPYLANKDGMVPIADDQTWLLANEILKNSDNPGRRLERESLVLRQSYVNTPWLIYNNDNAPWHSNDNINVFAKKYLGYTTGEDKEFIVRARINFISVIKYIIYA